MVSQDPTFPLFPICAFIGFILSLIPLGWHIQAWNSGTCAFMIWTALSCLIGFVDSIVWSGNFENTTPIWCDIAAKIIIGVSIGIPAATLCISRRLYYLTSGPTASLTRDDKRRMVAIDLCIAVGIPVLIMILHYVVQGHRFDILEDIGCFPVVYNTLPAYPLYFMWPVLLGVVSFCFSALTLRSFWIRRIQFTQLISSNNSMTVSRYMRLVMLALVDIMCTIPLAIFSIYMSNKGVGFAPWISWEDTHYDFSHVSRIPALIWRGDASTRTSVELTRWLPVVCAYVFFSLFGFASEARKFYKKSFLVVLKAFGIQRSSHKPIAKGLVTWRKQFHSTSPSSVGTLPVFNAKALDSSVSSDSKTIKCERSCSLSTMALHAVVDEFSAASVPTLDIEKQYRLSLRPFSPFDSDTSTLCGSPTAKTVPEPVLPPLLRRPSSQVPQDVSATPLPSPWTFGPSETEEHGPPFVVIENDEEEEQEVSPGTIQLPVHAVLPSQPPQVKTSESSLHTILAPERDRFYLVSTERSTTPSSPAPFSSTYSRSSSREDFHDDSDDEDTGSGQVRVIEVMVHTIATTI